MKLSLFFMRLPLLEIVLPGLEEGEDDVDPGKYDFFGVVGGENVAGVVGVVGRVGVVLGLMGEDGGCLAGSSAFAIPLLVPLSCLTSGFGSFFSSSFFSARSVLEEEVPLEAFLGLLIGRLWVEGASMYLGGSTAGGCLTAVVTSFTRTMGSGDFRLGGVGRMVGGTLSGAAILSV